MLLFQEHAQSLEAKLAATEAELAQLQIRQQKLQNRNQLLEKVAHIDSKRPGQRTKFAVGNSTISELAGLSLVSHVFTVH